MRLSFLDGCGFNENLNSRARINGALIALVWLALLTATSATSRAGAQAPAGGGGPDEGAAAAPGANATFEAGFHFGDLLPNQIAGVTEIMGLGGARVGFRMSPQSYFETGFITGNGEGQKWKNAHADFRMDIPIENLVGIAYVGADSIYYEGRSGGTRLIFGGHVGGGVMAHLAGSAWFRGDMKFGFSPGTSLYIGFGIVWRMGDGGST